MGCDIHTVWQARRGGKWHDVPSLWEEDRHYALFAWLANVRNYTYPITPISKPRGLPKDFEVNGDNMHPTSPGTLAEWQREFIDEYDGSPAIWMGDHSHSWLTADEILEASPPDEPDLSYFINEVRRMKDEHGEVRIVFGFDS